MWCKTCNIETNEDYCPICNTKTIEDIPAKIYWCPDCRIPIIQDETQANKGICPVCNTKIKYMSADLRPVFPEERLLIEILLEKKPNQFIKSSVWASNSRYYIDGKSFILPSKLFNKINVDDVIKKIDKYMEQNNYIFFDKYIERFIKANILRLNAFELHPKYWTY